MADKAKKTSNTSNPEKKVCFISGAASGIGRATAVAFAEAGYDLALLDLPATDLKGTAKLSAKFSSSALLLEGDVSSEKDIAAAFAKIKKHFKSLDVAVNNAGIDGGTKFFLQNTLDDFNKMMDVNVKGVFFCLQKELEVMKAQKTGSIVNIASILGLVGTPGASLYCASKHAVVGLTKTLAQEFARYGVRVNAVCPGGVDTPLLRNITQGREELLEQAKKMHPLGRLSQPEEIASAILWLASQGASFVTGHALAVDGGYTSA